MFPASIGAFNDSNDLASSLVKEFVGAHDGEEPVGVHLLPQPIEEDGEIVEVVEFGGLHGESDPVDGALVVDLDGEVTSVVVASELGGLDLPLGVSSGLLLGGLPSLFSLVP